MAVRPGRARLRRGRAAGRGPRAGVPGLRAPTGRVERLLAVGARPARGRAAALDPAGSLLGVPTQPRAGARRPAGEAARRGRDGGPGLALAASGLGLRAVARRLDVPHTTARSWWRRFRARAPT